MISLILTLVVLGLIAWAVTLIPIPQPFAQIIRVILIIVAVIYVVNYFLSLGGGTLIR